MKRLISEYSVTRLELSEALRAILPWVSISVVLSWLAGTVALVMFDIRDVVQHFALSTIMPILIGIPTLLPLAIVKNRLKATKSDLEKLLLIDVLTELPNRRAFFERANLAFQGADTVVVMMVDIDHFKDVNDIHGHDAGDALLCSVGRTIAEVIRHVPGNGERLTARLGGEEFCVLITNLPGPDCDQLAQSVVDVVKKSSCRYRGIELRASVSVGTAHRILGHTVGEVLRSADNAVYRAKRLGRGQWRSSCGNAEQERAVETCISGSLA